MKYSLAALVRRVRNPRRSIAIRPIAPTQALASDLAAIHLRVVKAWGQAVPVILAEYERSLPVNDAIRDAALNDSIADIAAAIDGVQAELSRLFLMLTPALRDWTLRVEKWHRGKWRGAVLSATGVDLDTMLTVAGQPQAVSDILAWNTALIRDVSDQTRQRIANIVFGGFQQRRAARDVAREMNEAVGLGRARSLRIASDQATKLAAALDGERMQEAGIDKWKWRWSHKRHGRAEHIRRDGKLYTFATAPEDLPGTLPFCGCRKQAVLTFD